MVGIAIGRRHKLGENSTILNGQWTVRLMLASRLLVNSLLRVAFHSETDQILLRFRCRISMSVDDGKLVVSDIDRNSMLHKMTVFRRRNTNC